MSETAEAGVLTTEEILSITRQHNYGTWRIQKTWKPMHVVDAEGCYFIDASGKRYLDFSSQLMCVNLGHKNPRVIESIAEQARELPYIAPGYATTSRAKLTQQLLRLLPEGLEKFFFATSGTEANEAAFKIARMYTGKTKIMARLLLRFRRRAIRGAGRWSRAVRQRAISSRRRRIAISARLGIPIRVAMLRVRITSSI